MRRCGGAVRAHGRSSRVLLIGVVLGVECMVLGCGGAAPPLAPSTPEQSQAAEARGLAFQRRVGGGQATDDERGRYHLVRLTTAAEPRIHTDLDLSLLVLSGKVRVFSGAGVVDLGPGQSVDIPNGHWYATQPGADGQTTVLFTFQQPRPSAAGDTGLAATAVPGKESSAKLTP